MKNQKQLVFHKYNSYLLLLDASRDTKARTNTDKSHPRSLSGDDGKNATIRRGFYVLYLIKFLKPKGIDLI